MRRRCLPTNAVRWCMAGPTDSPKLLFTLGTEPVMVDSHDPGAILGAFLRWADLRVMARGALV